MSILLYRISLGFVKKYGRYEYKLIYVLRKGMLSSEPICKMHSRNFYTEFLYQISGIIDGSILTEFIINDHRRKKISKNDVKLNKIKVLR